MKYMGSKNRIAKYILPIILKDRQPNQYYVETFCGGCNTIDKVDGLRIANDSHFYLIEMFKALQDGWVPPTYVSEHEYKTIKNVPEAYQPWLVGFVGFGCSYSGKWWGGFARNVSKDAPTRNYCNESKRNLLKQTPNIKGIEFHNKSYIDLEIPVNSIIYCDPPYKGVTGYKDKFDHEVFWEWCRKMSKSGHKVFISEYNAPEDFKCVWSKEICSSLTKDTGSKKGIEKLFIYNPI